MKTFRSEKKFEKKPFIKKNEEKKPEFVKPVSAPITTIYVGNLNYRRDEEGIKSLFAPFGYVRSVKILMRPGTDLKSGVAFVEMTNKEKALVAIETLDGQVVDDRTIKVSVANDRFSKQN